MNHERRLSHFVIRPCENSLREAVPLSRKNNGIFPQELDAYLFEFLDWICSQVDTHNCTVHIHIEK
jgi:hypothetical protein